MESKQLCEPIGIHFCEAIGSTIQIFRDCRDPRGNSLHLFEDFSRGRHAFSGAVFTWAASGPFSDPIQIFLLRLFLSTVKIRFI